MYCLLFSLCTALDLQQTFNFAKPRTQCDSICAFLEKRVCAVLRSSHLLKKTYLIKIHVSYTKTTKRKDC